MKAMSDRNLLHLRARFRAPFNYKYMYATFLEILNYSYIIQEGIEVRVEIQTCMLQTGISCGGSCGGGASAAVHGGGRFVGGGDSSCEETVRAGCGSLTAKALPDRLLLHLLHFSSAPALVRESGGPGDAGRWPSARGGIVIAVRAGTLAGGLRAS
jgi:hypothetical protein